MSVLILTIVGAVAALLLVMGVFATLHASGKRGVGFMHWTPVMIMLGMAVSSLASGRTLTTSFDSVSQMVASGGGVSSWMFRLSTVAIMLASGERLLSWLMRRFDDGVARTLFVSVFAYFWLTSVLAAGVWGARAYFQHDYLYPLVIGLAVCVLTDEDVEKFLVWYRNAVVVFVLASFAVLPVLPSMVLDLGYSQGLISGLPRMAGLAPHAITLGVLVMTAMLVLWARPFATVWKNRMAWGLLMLALVLAQSKMVWMSWTLCVLAMGLVRNGARWWKAMFDPRHRVAATGWILGLSALVMLAGGLVMFGGLGGRVQALLLSDEGAQLMTLTGRDQIWAVALAEWRRHPVFGYGLTAWDLSYRVSVGMLFATHGHNQIYDTLSRAGTVGLSGVLLLFALLLWGAFRSARSSGGLSIALLLFLTIQSMTEAPFTLLGYGPLTLPLLILMMLSRPLVKVDVPLGKVRG